jgi:hypothetical protein
MICDTCENGLGQISTIVLVPTVDCISEPCPTCLGAGYMCNRCLEPPAHCGCDDDEQEPPRARKQKPERWDDG